MSEATPRQNADSVSRKFGRHWHWYLHPDGVECGCGAVFSGLLAWNRHMNEAAHIGSGVLSEGANDA